MASVVVTFQVPITEDGTGNKHPPFRWRSLQDELFVRFGGWTDKGFWKGAWRSPAGVEIRDRSRVFCVDVPEERLEEMRAVLRSACKTFVQQCIRAEIDGRAEYPAGGADDQPL